jgi:hypothetical protein
MPTEEITNLTRTCQTEPFTTAGLLSALETAWAAIRALHSDVPAAVLIVGSGSPAKPNAAMKWGHFASLRWQHGDDQLPEVLISGEGLKRSPADVMVTLLHEAAHGLADARDIQDTSRQGRWHNKKFAALAAELGLSTERDDKLGYSPCTLTAQAAADYADIITLLGTALRAYRHPEVFGEGTKRTNNNNGVACECECPRKIRLSLAAFEEGPIVCTVCRAAFLPDDIDRDNYEFQNFNLISAINAPNQSTLDDSGPDDAEDPMVFYDPTGAKYGIPTYPFKMAPTGYATLRQLRADGLRPGGQSVAAQLMWRKGKRVAYLFRIDLAVPKRTATAAQLAALDKANRAKRVCPACGQLKTYQIPRRTGACLDCQPGGLS